MHHMQASLCCLAGTHATRRACNPPALVSCLAQCHQTHIAGVYCCLALASLCAHVPTLVAIDIHMSHTSGFHLLLADDHEL